MVAFFWVNCFLRGHDDELRSGYRRRDGAYHQVYLLSGGSLVGIARLKHPPSSPSSTYTPSLPPVVSHRKRTVVRDGEGSHGGACRSDAQSPNWPE